MSADSCYAQVEKQSLKKNNVRDLDDFKECIVKANCNVVLS